MKLQTNTFNATSDNSHCTKPWTKKCIMWYEWNGHLSDPKQEMIPVLLYQLLQMTYVIVYPHRRR